MGSSSSVMTWLWIQLAWAYLWWHGSSERPRNASSAGKSSWMACPSSGEQHSYWKIQCLIRGDTVLYCTHYYSFLGERIVSWAARSCSILLSLCKHRYWSLNCKFLLKMSRRRVQHFVSHNFRLHIVRVCVCSSPRLLTTGLFLMFLSAVTVLKNSRRSSQDSSRSSKTRGSSKISTSLPSILRRTPARKV